MAARAWLRIPASERRRYWRALPGDALGSAQLAEVRRQFPGATTEEIERDSWVVDGYCMLCDEPTRLSDDGTCDRHGVKGAVGGDPGGTGAAGGSGDAEEEEASRFSPWSAHEYARGALLWLSVGALAFGSTEMMLRRVCGARHWSAYVAAVDTTRAGTASEAIFLVATVAVLWTAGRQVLQAVRYVRAARRDGGSSGGSR